MNKVFCITGPTAVGKTKISIEFAKRHHLEIINGDAFQVYIGMDIGTAKPTLQERAIVPHHFFDIIPSTNEFSVCEYQTRIRELFTEFHKLNKIPMIVGGSGFYLDAALFDYQFNSPSRTSFNESELDSYSNNQIRALLDDLHYDEEHKIPLNNRKRLLRAYQIAISSNNQKQVKRNFDALYDICQIFLTDDRAAIYSRINQRVDCMMNEGLLSEVKSLYPAGFSKTSKEAIGYKQLIRYLENECSLIDAVEDIKKTTRHFAKRQITWFHNHPYTHILSIENKSFEEIQTELESIYNEWMKKEEAC